MTDSNSDTPPSDALVLFGVTGDLARKKIFPAHYLAIPPALFEAVINGLGAAGPASSRQA